jgi:hypothetical protein
VLGFAGIGSEVAAKEPSGALQSGNVLAVATQLNETNKVGPTERDLGDQVTVKGDPEVTIISVRNPDSQAEKAGRGGLGSRIAVTVKGLSRLLEMEAARKEKVVLYIDGMPIHLDEQPYIDRIRETLIFTLERTEDAKTAWKALLGQPRAYVRPVLISVGFPSDRGAFSTESGLAKNFDLVVIQKFGFWGWIVFLGASLVLVTALGKGSALLRNYGSGSPFSLALTQMGFWSFLVVSAYIFIFLITGAQPPINGSILILLGIGTGTALGGRIIDENKMSGQLRKLGEEKEKLVSQMKTASYAPEKVVAPDSTKTELEGVEKAITAVKALPDDASSKGFFTDILNDVNGISIHRFQMFIWTIVLGAIFCRSVYQDLEMPQFSETLLALIGISSGTYLGFKLPERNA